MKLEEFLNCDHDIDMDTSMTRLYCLKCGQDANVINHVTKTQSLLDEAVKVFKNELERLGSYPQAWSEKDRLDYIKASYELIESFLKKLEQKGIK